MSQSSAEGARHTRRVIFTTGFMAICQALDLLSRQKHGCLVEPPEQCRIHGLSGGGGGGEYC